MDVSPSLLFHSCLLDRQNKMMPGAEEMSGFVEFLVGQILKKAISLSKEQCFMQLQINKSIEKKLLLDLEALQNGIHYIHETMSEFSRHDSPIRSWIVEVKDFAYDAEDLFDEITTTASPRKKIHHAKHAMMMATMEKGWQKKRLLDETHHMIERLSDLLNKNKMILRSTEVLHSKDHILQMNKMVESGYMQPYGFEMIGREKEENEIKNLLGVLLPTTHMRTNVSILGIVGMAGIGKTTLIQSIYNDDCIKEHFTYMKWLHVGDFFDSKGLINTLLKDPTTQPSTKLFSKDMQLEYLQERLKDKLQDHKFLIVLDDVWNEDSNRWKELWTPLSYGGKGSRVIITTQSQDVMSTTVQSVSFPLDELPDELCYKIIENHAIENKDVFQHKALENICTQVVGKIMGHPLAAALAGKKIATSNIKEWQSIVDKETWNAARDSELDLIPRLIRSYNHLPSEVKPCFQYLSLIPKGNTFDKMDVILKWKALDLLYNKETLSLEDMGRKHFDILLHRSFLIKMDDSRYYMHNLIHDLAMSVFPCECKTIYGTCDVSKVEKARHLSIYNSHKQERNKHESLFPASMHQKIRTLHYFCEIGASTHVIQDNLFRTFKHLRVLDFSNSNITTLPRTIDKLTLLRYLNLSNCHLNKLPESLCDLHNLQILKLSGNHDLNMLPSNMSKLVNLQYLQIPVIFSGIRKLRKLQELPEFTILRLENSNNSNIDELRDINELRGCLRINNLQILQNEDDAKNANLMDKRNLDALVLNWDWEENRRLDIRKRKNMIRLLFKRRHDRHMILDYTSSSHGNDKDLLIFESLKPNSNLRRLEIHNFNGASCPNWFTQLTHKQVTICLEGCSNLTSIDLPKNITVLKLVDCQRLQVCCLDDGGTRLNKLVIRKCPMFENIKSIEEVNTLEELTIDNWALLWKTNTGPQSHDSLKKLCITELIASTNDDHHQLKYLKSLEHLCFQNCKDINSLPSDICYLTSLSKLEVFDCPGITSLPILSTSLKHLNIHGSLKMSRPMVEKKDISSTGDKQRSIFSWEMIWRCIEEILRPLSDREMKLISECIIWWNSHFSLIPFIRFCFVSFLTLYNCTRIINKEWWGTMAVALTACLLITIARKLYVRSP